jgi:hypothetical protein
LHTFKRGKKYAAYYYELGRSFRLVYQVINTALDGNADYVVSGDPHLLSLSNYKGIEIVTVNDMLKKFGY